MKLKVSTRWSAKNRKRKRKKKALKYQNTFHIVVNIFLSENNIYIQILLGKRKQMRYILEIEK